jgi:hypothetical protein
MSRRWMRWRSRIKLRKGKWKWSAGFRGPSPAECQQATKKRCSTHIEIFTKNITLENVFILIPCKVIFESSYHGNKECCLSLW